MIRKKRSSGPRGSARRGGADTPASPKKKAKPNATENRCRLVYIERDNRAPFFYMPWEPESEGEKLLAFGGWALANITEVHDRFIDVCVQYEKPIGEDGRTLEKLPPDPPLRFTPAQIVAMHDQLMEQKRILEYINITQRHQREIDQIEHDELIRTHGSKGGQNKLRNETKALIDIYKTMAPDMRRLTPTEFIELAQEQKRVAFTMDKSEKCWTITGNATTATLKRDYKALGSLLRTVTKHLGITKS